MAYLIISTNLSRQNLSSPCDHQQSLLNMAINQPLISVPKPNPTFQFYSTSKGIRREERRSM